MFFDHADYSKLVTVLFHQKLANRELPRFITKSSPARLKKSFEDICKKGFPKKDERVFVDFFGQPKEGQSFQALIRRTKADRLKPLNNFIIGETKTTDALNIELLAWLVDFRHRPYSLGMQVQLSEDELTILGKSRDVFPVKNETEEEEKFVENVTEGKEEEKPAPLPEVVKENGERKRGLLIKMLNGFSVKEAAIHILLFLLTISCVYIYHQSERPEPIAYKSGSTENAITQGLLSVNYPAAAKQVPTKTVAPPVKKYKVPMEERCQAITKKGTQCKRRAQADGYCWQHPL